MPAVPQAPIILASARAKRVPRVAEPRLLRPCGAPYGQTICRILPPDLSSQKTRPRESVHIRQSVPSVCETHEPHVDGGGAALLAMVKAANADKAMSRRMLVLLP